MRSSTRRACRRTARETVAVRRAAEGRRLGGAAVTDLGAEMLLGEGVGGVHLLVTPQAELSGVRAAVQNRLPRPAEITPNHRNTNTTPI